MEKGSVDTIFELYSDVLNILNEINSGPMGEIFDLLSMVGVQADEPSLEEFDGISRALKATASKIEASIDELATQVNDQFSYLERKTRS